MNKIQQHLLNTEKRFDEKIKELKNADHISEKPVEFGYKCRIGDNLQTITDFGNIKSFIKQREQELIELIRGEVIEMLESTDVQMSVNGDVSEDEKAMAKFLYKAHCNHIIKKLQTYGK